MKLLLCGDSWMHGCYQIPEVLEPTHPGLQSFLVEDGHSVINLAVQGSSNELQLQKIDTFFSHTNWRPDVVIFMQCALMRRFRNYTSKSFRRMIHDDMLFNGVSRQDFDFNGDSVEDILSPIVHKLAKQLEAYNLPILIASGNTKMHPVWNDYFDRVLPSGDDLWAKHTDNSYFSDRDSIERFGQVLMKYCQDHSRKFKKDLMIQAMEDFTTKWEAWQNNPRWIAWEHGRLNWHHELYKRIIEIL